MKKAEDNSVVGITYILKEKGNDAIVESVNSDNPFYFLLGVGHLLPLFEENMKGLAAGEHFEFTLEPNDAYGPKDEKAIIDIPITVFMIDGKVAEEMIQVGKVVHLQDQEGHPLNGTVISRGLEQVKVDFNHPMAGKTLHFSGEVIEVREATPEELSHGHVHGPHGHHH